MKSFIQPTYSQRRDSYLTRFPAAYRFLKTLEEDPCDELWLSTAVNAHLYKGNCFLAYIVLSDPLAPPSLILSPHFNLRIREGTSDCSKWLFPDAVRRVLERHRPDSLAWSSLLEGDRFELRSDTPDVVFSGLLNAIRSLPLMADVPPANQQACVAADANLRPPDTAISSQSKRLLLTEDEMNGIVEQYDTDREFRVSKAFPDGGAGMIAPRLRRAALNQLCDGPAALSRYGIWANTVRDTIRKAEQQMTEGNISEARRLMCESANSLSAFAQLQARFDKTE